MFEEEEESDNYKFRAPNEDEADDESDPDGNSRQMMKCPNCKKWMLEDSPKCPYCKNWVEERQEKARPTWAWVTAVILLALCLLWLALTSRPLW